MGDFGLATKVDYDGERKRTLCGTPNYIAPEVLTKKGTFTCRKLKIEYKSLICGKGNHCNLSIYYSLQSWQEFEFININ